MLVLGALPAEDLLRQVRAVAPARVGGSVRGGRRGDWRICNIALLWSVVSNGARPSNTQVPTQRDLQRLENW